MNLGAAKLDGSTPFEDISMDDNAGDHIVQPNARRTVMRAASNVTPPVPADHNAAIQRIAKHIESALVVRFLNDVANHVQFDEMVVAFDTHRRGRDPLEQVMGDAVAAAVEMNSRRIGPLEP